MKLAMILTTTFLLLTGCATTGGGGSWAKEYVFVSQKPRAQAELTSDYEYCKLYSRTVRKALQFNEETECMQRRGYDLVEKQAAQ